jgi:hypothetical protein
MVSPITLGRSATSATAVAKDFIVVKKSGTVYVEEKTRVVTGEDDKRENWMMEIM